MTSDPVVVSLPRLPAKAARIWYQMEPARKGALDDGRCDGVGVVLKSQQEEAGKWRTLADIFVTEVEWSLREVDVPEGAELRLEVDRGPADGNHDVAQIAFELKVE